MCDMCEKVTFLSYCIFLLIEQALQISAVIYIYLLTTRIYIGEENVQMQIIRCI